MAYLWISDHQLNPQAGRQIVEINISILCSVLIFVVNLRCCHRRGHSEGNAAAVWQAAAAAAGLT